jgi:hypothetical protein
MRRSEPICRVPLWFSMGLLMILLAIAKTPLLKAQDKDGAGIVVSGKANVKDIGLPIYPGSKPHQDKDDDSTGANLGLWGGGAGFKLAVLKLESGDSPERIAAFYKKALSKYGNVLDCSSPSPAAKNAEKADSSKALTCGDDQPEKGGMLYKSGTKDHQHIVGIQPNGQGTIYQLVKIGSWGSK